MGFTLKERIQNGQVCLMKISSFNISFLINKCKIQEAKYLANESSVMMYRHFYIILIQIKFKTRDWTDGSAIKDQFHNQNYKTQDQKGILIFICWVSRVANLPRTSNIIELISYHFILVALQLLEILSSILPKSKLNFHLQKQKNK